MKIGDRVTHIDFPGQTGVIVAKTKRWASGPPIFLVKWGISNHCSRHIPSALRRVG